MPSRPSKTTERAAARNEGSARAPQLQTPNQLSAPRRRPSGPLADSSPRTDRSATLTFFTGPALPGDAPYDWSGQFPYQVRSVPSSGSHCIMSVPDRVKPIDPLPLEQENPQPGAANKYKDIRRAYLILASAGSVYRSGQRRCTNCVKRFREEGTCLIGCVSASLDNDGACGECRARGTGGACSLSKGNVMRVELDRVYDAANRMMQEFVRYDNVLKGLSAQEVAVMGPGLLLQFRTAMNDAYNEISDIPPVKENILKRRLNEVPREIFWMDYSTTRPPRIKRKKSEAQQGQGLPTLGPSLGRAAGSSRLQQEESDVEGDWDPAEEGDWDCDPVEINPRLARARAS